MSYRKIQVGASGEQNGGNLSQISHNSHISTMLSLPSLNGRVTSHGPHSTAASKDGTSSKYISKTKLLKKEQKYEANI